MKMIVGLGNPGRKYEATRHNVGWEVLAEFHRRFGRAAPRVRFQGELAEASVDDQQVWLLCPHTYMNRSGASVQPARDFYKLANEDLIVVCDDMNLPTGRLRFRAKGSSGGQKGLEDIIRRLGTDEFPRLRIGIDSPPPHWDAVGYVLGKFDSQQRPIMDQAIKLAADALADWARSGVQTCMNRYNANWQIQGD
jgi:peptidyl-tRNA hydrolase, PTH1 family